MSDTGIFIVGTLSFLLLSGGWIFTVAEVRRLGAEADARLLALKSRVDQNLG